MIEIISAGFLSLFLCIFSMPQFIKYLKKEQYGQFVRKDGPRSHYVKNGIPTMGGVIIITSTVFSYLIIHSIFKVSISSTGLLFLFLIVGMCLVGLFDDYLKIAKKQNLGLNMHSKIIGQLIIGTIFAFLSIKFPNNSGITPSSMKVSFIDEIPFFDFELISIPLLGIMLFLVWINFIIVSISNGVNLSDGLDGLAAGASIIVFSAYLIISIYQNANSCNKLIDNSLDCYNIRDPYDLSILSAGLIGACLGFLWWNTSPAKIFMGDAGSLSLGAAIGGLSILTKTELLLPIIGGLFVIITLSVLIQVGYFKYSGGTRIFKMAPLEHHFELSGWSENTVVIRFWIISFLFTSFGLWCFFTKQGVNF